MNKALDKNTAYEMVILENRSDLAFSDQCGGTEKHPSLWVIPAATEEDIMAIRIPRHIAYHFLNPVCLLDDQRRSEEEWRVVHRCESMEWKEEWQKAFAAMKARMKPGNREYDLEMLPLFVREITQEQVPAIALPRTEIEKFNKAEVAHFAELAEKTRKRGRPAKKAAEEK